MATETTEKQELENEEEIQDGLTTESADPTEYTLDKQILDQERANTRRAREELSSANELVEQLSEKADTLEKELEELKQSQAQERSNLEAQQQEAQEKLDDMDPDLVDPQVIKNFQTLSKALKRQDEQFQKEKTELINKIQSLNEKAAKYEAERAETQRQKEHDKAVESVLTRVESSLKRQGVTTPGQYRTEAMKIADDLVDKGDRKRPENILEGIDLMEECYLQVISKHQKKNNKGVSVDGGKSGVTSGVKAKSERKTGTLDEVAADMLKDKSWKED